MKDGNGGLWFLGAVLFAGYLLGRRRSRPPAYTPPPGWGALPGPRPVSAKRALAAIVIIAGLLTGASMTGQAAGGKGKAKSGRSLGSIFGGIITPTDRGKPVNATVRALLKSKRLELTPRARADLKAGRVDHDLVKILAKLLKHHRLSVSVFKTGHTKHVAGTNRVSRHYSGRGVDIWKVDGGLVRAGHHPSLDVARKLTRISPYPAEVGSPFGRLARGFFTDAGHWDHLHIGVR